jgi:hypothetical protein
MCGEEIAGSGRVWMLGVGVYGFSMFRVLGFSFRMIVVLIVFINRLALVFFTMPPMRRSRMSAYLWFWLLSCR